MFPNIERRRLIFHISHCREAALGQVGKDVSRQVFQNDLHESLLLSYISNSVLQPCPNFLTQIRGQLNIATVPTINTKLKLTLVKVAWTLQCENAVPHFNRASHNYGSA